MRAWIGVLFGLTLFLAACGEDDLVKEDAGPGKDGSSGTSLASSLDLGTRSDAGAFPCDPLASSSAPDVPAQITGQVQITDFDFFDDSFSMSRDRTRNAGINFLTFNLRPRPGVDGAMFTGLALDSCVVFEQLLPYPDLGPARNIGTTLTITNGAGKTIELVRGTSGSSGRLSYEWVTQQDVSNFFDPAFLSLSEPWTYFTPGDSTAGIRPASGTVPPLGDFEVNPAFTETASAAMIDPDNATFTWTGSGPTSEFTIEFDRALTPEGDGRFLLCRVVDDGEFTIPRSSIDDFGATPGEAFGLVVARSSLAPFCNEGVTSGLLSHVLAYIGSGVLP
jgi:hypothetical protein